MRDKFPSSENMTAEAEESQRMGVTAPWPTGCTECGPLAGLTGTRPVVDQYSLTRYSEDEWRKHNADVLGGADKETHHAKVYVYLKAYAITRYNHTNMHLGKSKLKESICIHVLFLCS
jgi:hypothetical protein